jgi:hypothetical protein
MLGRLRLQVQPACGESSMTASRAAPSDTDADTTLGRRHGCGATPHLDQIADQSPRETEVDADLVHCDRRHDPKSSAAPAGVTDR